LTTFGEVFADCQPVGTQYECICGRSFNDAEIVDHGLTKFEAICDCGRPLVIWQHISTAPKPNERKAE